MFFYAATRRFTKFFFDRIYKMYKIGSKHPIILSILLILSKFFFVLLGVASWMRNC